MVIKKHGAECIIEVFILRFQVDSVRVVGFGVFNVIEVLVGGSKISPGISDFRLQFHSTLVVFYGLLILLSRRGNFAQMQLDMSDLLWISRESAGLMQVFFSLIKTLIFLNQYLSQGYAHIKVIFDRKRFNQ